MKLHSTRRGLTAPLLLGATAVAFAPVVRAQSDAVTQFAPLEDSPVPSAPNSTAATPRVPEPTPQPSSAANAPAYAAVAPYSAPSSSAPTWPANSSATPAAQPAVSPPPNPAPPTLGSSWLGASTTTTPTPPAVEPQTTVVDSGLPLFVEPSPTPNADTPSKEKTSHEEDEETHRVALTFSLARAFLLPAVVPSNVKNTALYEGTVELKVFERLSVAVLGGVGGFDVPLSQLAENVHVNGKELGGQARIYVLGDFDHGLSIGGEYLRVWAEADPISVEAVPPPPLPPGTGVLTGEATLTGLGGFVGYKVTANFGLTFDAKLGVQKLTAEGLGTVSGEIGPGYPTLTESETFRYEQLVPLVNVNVGWAI